MTVILVIDDAVTLLDELSTILNFEGYQVLTASNGRDGLQLACEQRPDLILCDVMMPEMDGYQVLQRVRQDEALKDTPFIFVTAMAHSSSRQPSEEEHANGYLTKPFDMMQLLGQIQSLLHTNSRE